MATLKTTPANSIAGSHLLLISEDQGNQLAVEYAQKHLANGSRVTWICSSPSSSELTQLEVILGLKNSYMSTLNLLVITRAEKQPFDVLTGSLNAERLQQCAENLFDVTSVTACAMAGTTSWQEQLKSWFEGNLTNLDLNSLTTEGDWNSVVQQPPDTKNNVAVTIIVQGREQHYTMDRTAGTLLDGAEDAGLDLPFSCRGGVCSTCRAKLVNGEVELIENYALEEWELDEGFTLPCQAEPVSAEIRLDYDQV